MHPDLIDQIAKVHRQCFKNSWSAKTISDVLQVPGTISLTTRVKETLVGFIIGRVVVDEAEILTLAIFPEHREQGLGKKLVKNLLNEFAKQKVKTAFLEVVETNRTALGLYESLGFYKVGTRKGYYAASHEKDACIFKKNL